MNSEAYDERGLLSVRGVAVAVGRALANDLEAPTHPLKAASLVVLLQLQLLHALGHVHAPDLALELVGCQLHLVNQVELFVGSFAQLPDFVDHCLQRGQVLELLRLWQEHLQFLPQNPSDRVLLLLEGPEAGLDAAQLRLNFFVGAVALQDLLDLGELNLQAPQLPAELS